MSIEPRGANGAPILPPTRIFVDMDGVLVDFEGHMASHGLDADACKRTPGAYRAMRPVAGAIAAVREVAQLGFEVWIATKPPTGQPHAYAEKAAWVIEHLPELAQRIIITHHKGLLGSRGDILVDDRPHKAGCYEFKGQLVHFGCEPFHGWPEVLEWLRQQVPQVKARRAERWRLREKERVGDLTDAERVRLDALEAELVEATTTGDDR